MTPEQKQSFINIIRSCEDVILATHGPGQYPDTRNVINIFNREIKDLDLYFFTSTKWHTLGQIRQNQNVCLYYFNAETRMALRLFGTMTIVEDMDEKQNRFLSDIKKFGVTGYDDPTYVMMKFAPKKYKYYIGWTDFEGEIFKNRPMRGGFFTTTPSAHFVRVHPFAKAKGNLDRAIRT